MNRHINELKIGVEIEKLLSISIPLSILPINPIPYQFSYRFLSSPLGDKKGVLHSFLHQKQPFYFFPKLCLHKTVNMNKFNSNILLLSKFPPGSFLKLKFPPTEHSNDFSSVSISRVVSCASVLQVCQELVQQATFRAFWSAKIIEN